MPIEIESGEGHENILPLRSGALYSVYRTFELQYWEYLEANRKQKGREPFKTYLMNRAVFNRWMKNAPSDEIHESLHKWGMTPEEWIEEMAA